MSERDQLSLFGGPSAPPPRVAPASRPADEHTLREGLPATLRMGTSSWSFPGWEGLVYGGKHSDRTLSREGLPAYAAHPLFRTVGVDRGYYAPIPRDDLERYAAQVPDDFRFLVKAWEGLVVPTWPSHRRYAARAGQANASFLDPELALDEVVGPLVESLGDKLGVLLFQAPPHDIGAVGGPGRWLTLLERFLEGLPPDARYAFEVRNRALLQPDFFEILDAFGASAVLAHHPSLPPITEQRRSASGPLVVRWMLRRGMRYDAAKARYAPFDARKDPDDVTRDAIADAVIEAALSERPTYVIVNNKAEGSSPLSVRALAGTIAERWPLLSESDVEKSRQT